MSRWNHITVEYLLEAFEEFESGRLLWKKRPLYHFESENVCNAVNTRFSGKEAGGLAPDPTCIVGHRWKIRIDGHHVWRYQIIWKIHTDKWVTNLDHRNGNGIDDRFENLRSPVNSDLGWSAGSLQRANSPKHRDGNNKYKGVYKIKGGNTYKAQITVNYKQLLIGCFNTPEEARDARTLYGREIFGEFYNPD